jgi:hypothetical protein
LLFTTPLLFLRWRVEKIRIFTPQPIGEGGEKCYIKHTDFLRVLAVSGLLGGMTEAAFLLSTKKV